MAHRCGCYGKEIRLKIFGVADTITVRTGEATEHTIEVLTQDGSSQLAAVRQAMRHMNFGEPDGVNAADKLARGRAGER